MTKEEQFRKDVIAGLKSIDITLNLIRELLIVQINADR